MLALHVVDLQAVAEAQVAPPGQGAAVPGVHVPVLLHNPVGVISEFPCESTVHDAVPQLAPVLATQVPVADEQMAHPEQAFPVLCQAPLASQVCGWEPLHCFAPGVQAPEHAPVALLQRWGQAVPLSCHAPLALQTWGCSPLHCADIGLQEPAQAPVALLQR